MYLRRRANNTVSPLRVTRFLQVVFDISLFLLVLTPYIYINIHIIQYALYFFLARGVGFSGEI